MRCENSTVRKARHFFLITISPDMDVDHAPKRRRVPEQSGLPAQSARDVHVPEKQDGADSKARAAGLLENATMKMMLSWCVDKGVEPTTKDKRKKETLIAFCVSEGITLVEVLRMLEVKAKQAEAARAERAETRRVASAKVKADKAKAQLDARDQELLAIGVPPDRIADVVKAFERQKMS